MCPGPDFTDNLILKGAVPTLYGDDEAILVGIRERDGARVGWVDVLQRGAEKDGFWAVGAIVEFGGRQWRVTRLEESSSTSSGRTELELEPVPASVQFSQNSASSGQSSG